MNNIIRRINNALRDKKFIEAWDYNYIIDNFDKTAYLRINVDYTTGKYITKVIPLSSETINTDKIIDFILNFYYEN